MVRILHFGHEFCFGTNPRGILRRVLSFISVHQPQRHNQAHHATIPLSSDPQFGKPGGCLTRVVACHLSGFHCARWLLVRPAVSAFLCFPNVFSVVRHGPPLVVTQVIGANFGHSLLYVSFQACYEDRRTQIWVTFCVEPTNLGAIVATDAFFCCLAFVELRVALILY